MRLILLAILILFSSLAIAQPNESWDAWLQQLRQEAISQGISPKVFDTAFANIHGPNAQVLYFNRTQPEKRMTFLQYRKSRIDSMRIRMGKFEYQKNQNLLNYISNNYNIDPCFVAAIWGIETSYGHYMGTFPVINSLSTLAYESNREEYFRSELLIALHILNDGHVSINHFKGEWAGASGYPQFMPSSWEKYAVDYNNDGRKDIWTSPADGLASIGNYLAKNGWQKNQPWAIQVILPATFDDNLLGLNIVKTVNQWNALGVQPANGFNIPDQTLNASILQPNGGPTFMVFDNFKTILTYNKSIFYVCSVGYLADKICGRE